MSELGANKDWLPTYQVPERWEKAYDTLVEFKSISAEESLKMLMEICAAETEITELREKLADSASAFVTANEIVGKLETDLIQLRLKNKDPVTELTQTRAELKRMREPVSDEELEFWAFMSRCEINEWLANRASTETKTKEKP
jgi:hypothetical protein